MNGRSRKAPVAGFIDGPDIRPRVAIVGAGFSGTLLAVHLLQTAHVPVVVHLYERHGWFGRGVAYSTVNPSHLLNVRVANMSAFPHDPQHFHVWLRSVADHLEGASVPPGGHAFVPRGLYGSYLEDTLRASAEMAADGVAFEMRAEDVSGIEPTGTGYALRLHDGRSADYGHVVLCIGNLPPALPCAVDCGADHPRLIGDPWHEPALAEIDPADPVVIIGTGLTAVDVVLSLLDLDHKGPITLVSRRGLLPNTHAETSVYRDFLAGQPAPGRILDLFVRLRREVRDAAAAGCDWRSVIDAFRPHTERCWQALPLDERRRFLRHLRAYWEVHRHRMAPQVSQRLHAALATGRVLRRESKLKGITEAGDGLLVRLRDRSGQEDVIRTAYVIIATGPELDPRRSDNALIASLLSHGLIRPDPLGLGLDVGADFRLLGADGRPAPGLFAVGPIARGGSWEATAVPELRVHCARLGRAIAGELAARAEGAA